MTKKSKKLKGRTLLARGDRASFTFIGIAEPERNKEGEVVSDQRSRYIYQGGPIDFGGSDDPALNAETQDETAEEKAARLFTDGLLREGLKHEMDYLRKENHLLSRELKHQRQLNHITRLLSTARGSLNGGPMIDTLRLVIDAIEALAEAERE